MLRQLFAFGFALLVWNATADIRTAKLPIDDILALEIEELELEFELFSDAYIIKDVVEIESLELYEPDEELEFNFDTEARLPEDFNPREGMEDLDWSTIELYEIEEEEDFGFETKNYLPEGFDPYKKVSCDSHLMLSSRL